MPLFLGCSIVNAQATACMTGESPICNGTNATLTFSITGIPPVTIYYSVNSVQYSIPGINTTEHIESISILSNYPNQIILDSIVDANGIGTICSNGDTVAITNRIPDIINFAQSSTLFDTSCLGYSSNLFLNLDGPIFSKFEISYTDGTTMSTISGISSTPYIFNFSPTTATTYTFTDILNKTTGCVKNNLNYNLEVVVDTMPTSTIASNQSICFGNNSNISLNIVGGRKPWIIEYDIKNQSFSRIQDTTFTSPYITSTPLLATTTYLFLKIINYHCPTYYINDSIILSPISLPNVSITGQDTICSGLSDSLQFSLSGNSPWEITYTDGTNPTTIFGINSSIYSQITPPILNSTTYNILNVSDANCSNNSIISSYTNVIRNPTISSTSPVCEGDTLFLNIIGIAPGSTFNWIGPSGFTSNLNNPFLSNINVVDSGIYSLTVTDPLCGIFSIQSNVEVNMDISSATISPNATICASQNIVLTCSYHSGANYLWEGPNGYSSLLQNPTISNASTLASGQYSLTIISPVCADTIYLFSNITVNTGPTINAGTNGPICQGNSLSLTVNTVSGASSYMWTGPLSFTSASQNASISNAQPNRTGIYTLTVNTSSCGLLERTVNVRVTATIVFGNFTQGTPTCIGDTINLNLTNPTDTIGVSINWAGPNGFTAGSIINPSILNAQTINAGIYTLTLTNTVCQAQPKIVTKTLVINDSSTVSASVNNTVCVGSAVYFTASGLAGTTYYWIAHDGFTSILQNPSRSNSTVAMAGTYTVTATVPSCGPVIRVINLVVRPTLSGSFTTYSNTPVCEGNNLIVSANNSGNNNGLGILWSGPNGFSSTSLQNTISSASTLNSGTYTISATGCNSTNNYTTNVTVNSTAPFSASNDQPCIGGNLNLTSTLPSTYSSLLWTGPSGFTSNVANPTRSNVNNSAEGTYTLSIAVSGCGTQTTTTTFAAPCRIGSNFDDQIFDIDLENQSNLVIIYPNPLIHDILTVKYDTEEVPDLLSWKIFQVDGKNWEKANAQFDLNTKEFKIKIPTSFSNGIYLIRFEDSDNRIFHKTITVNR